MQHGLSQGCGLCGSEEANLTIINKQIGGEYKTLLVCSKCAKEHERELELTRSNFRMQFGDN